jgi:hypothetical protein
MSADLADNLGNVKQAPIPTEQRLDVFVADGTPEEALVRWESQGGKSVFHFCECSKNPSDWGSDLSKKCGIALFMMPPRSEDGRLSAHQTRVLRPFYDRSGSESNVFEWQPLDKNFVRRDLDWFLSRAATKL